MKSPSVKAHVNTAQYTLMSCERVCVRVPGHTGGGGYTLSSPKAFCKGSKPHVKSINAEEACLTQGDGSDTRNVPFCRVEGI